MGGDTRAVPPTLREALAAYPEVEAEAADVEATPLGGGLLHASWAVHSARGEFVTQRVNPVFAPAIHENIAAVSAHLATRGCPTISLCKTADAGLFVDTASGERWRLMHRLPGVTFETCGRSEQARAAGVAVGEFQSALEDFDRPLAPIGFPFHDTDHHLAELREAIAAHGDHPRAGDVSALATKVFEAVEAYRPPPGLPLRVVHGDLKFSNVLFAGREAPACDRAVALIDLDTVCRLPIYFDMGDAWRSWSNRRAEDAPEADLDPAIFVAAAEGYRARLSVALGEAERRSLERALENVALELCARFATDVLRERYFAWDDTRFASSSEHNWARARGQWSLYEQARETEAERLLPLRD